MFQAAPTPQQYAPPPRPQTPKWLTGVAIGVIVVMTAGAIYWFFGRSQSTSAVAETSPAVTAPAPAATATGNPVERFVEVTGVRFEPITKGIVVKFVVVNHSDQDLVGLTGSANITAKTNTGGEVPVGSVKFQTSLAAHASQELTLPFETKKKMVDMPDWQNVGVKVAITSPSGA
jgi:hypothetical protein